MTNAVGRVADAFRRDALALRRADTPSLRALRRKLSKDVKAWPAADVVALAQALIARGYRWVGYEVLTMHKGALASLRIAHVEALAHGLASWDGVDTFGLYISGPAWRAGQIRDADIKRWARSDDLWKRRAALVSTVVLNSKTRGDGGSGGDAKRTLAICTLLIDDREDMVVKALSWALRVLAAVDPAPVRAFLKARDSRLAARVKRETRNKLATGLKNPK